MATAPSFAVLSAATNLRYVCGLSLGASTGSTGSGKSLLKVFLLGSVYTVIFVVLSGIAVALVAPLLLPRGNPEKVGAAAFLIAFPLCVLAGFTLAWCQERGFLRLPDPLMRVVLIVGACLFGLLGLAGVVGNLQFMARGRGIPADPVNRLGYLVGMWLCPVTLFAIAVGCGTIAYVMATRQRRP